MKRINMIILCVFVGTLMGFCSEKGSIKGRIIDKTTGLGLSDVNVILIGTQFGAASMVNGEFHMDRIDPGQYVLRVSAVGYQKFIIETVTVKTDEVTSVHVELEPVIINLDKVVITATRRPRLLEQTPDVTIVHTADEIRLMGAVQVDEVVQYMPGVSSIGGTMAGQPFKRTISINGMPAYYSLILLDGRRVLSSHIHTGTDVNIIPPEHIERIELIKGANSALYGTDGIGGTLNIITRKGTDKPCISFTSFTGSQKTYHNGLSVTGPIGKHARHSLFSSWEQSDGTPIIKPAQRKGKLSYAVFHLYDQVDIQIGNRFKAGVSFQYMNTATPYQQAPDASWLLTPGFKMEYMVSNELTVLSSAYFSQWKSQKNNELNEITSPEVILEYYGLKKHQILFGTNWISRNFSRTRVEEHSQTILGFFLQDEIQFSRRLRLLSALRIDKVEKIDPVLCPKVSVLYSLNDRVDLRIAAGRGFRAPTVQDLYETLYSHPGDIHFRAGNPDLKPEYSITFNGGIDWRLSNRFSFLINGYYYSIQNMITPIDHGLEDPTRYFPREAISFVSDSLVYIYRRENIHRGKIFGGEASFLWNLAPGYSIESGFTISHNRNMDTGESLPYYPGKTLSFKIRVRQPVWNGLTIGGFIGLNVAMDRRVWLFKHYAEQNITLKDYQKLDVGLNLMFRNGYELFFNGDNLLRQELNLYEDVEFVIEGIRLFRVGLKLNTQ